MPVTSGYTKAEAEVVCDAIVSLTCKKIEMGVSCSFVRIFLADFSQNSCVETLFPITDYLLKQSAQSFC